MNDKQKNLGELREERARLFTELEEIAKRNGDDIEQWPTGQVTRYENVSRSLDRTDDLIAAVIAQRDEARDRVRQAAMNPANCERAFPDAAELTTRTGSTTRRRDPWSGIERAGSVEALDSDTGLRTRAADAVETFEDVPQAGREALARMLEDDRTSDAARTILALGNPEYRGAFENWLRSPETAAMDSTPAELAAWRDVAAMRAALSTSGASALIPLAIDPALHLTNTGAAASIRDYASVKTTTTNGFRAVVSPGINAEWKVEGSEAADATPTITGADLSVYQGFASVMGSYEVFEDTDAAARLSEMFVDARLRLEADAFVTGSGSGAPYGVITRLAATTASRVTPTTGGTFTTASVADIFKVRDAVPARHRQSRKVAWLANIGIASVIQQMSPSANGSSFWADLSEGTPARLLGIPFTEATSMVATSTTGSHVLACVDLADYIIADRLGTSVERHNVHGTSGGRSTGQWEFVARWRTSGDLVNTAAGRVLKL